MASSHLPGPELVKASFNLFRVARADNPLGPYKGKLLRPLGRFDLPGVRVLYFATDLRGCFAETLANFRPDTAVQSAIKAVRPGFLVAGATLRNWRTDRVVVTAECPTGSLFVDVESLITRQYLETVLADRLSALHVNHLTVSDIRGEKRKVTQAIAKWAYDEMDAHKNPLYSGIRYVSKHGDYECWAVFARVKVTEISRDVIRPDDPALTEISDLFNVKVY